MVAPPENTEEETERTFEFIRDLKRINPETEVVVYIYTTLPDESRHESDSSRRPPMPKRALDRRRGVSPTTAVAWAQPGGGGNTSHADALLHTDRLPTTVNHEMEGHDSTSPPGEA